MGDIVVFLWISYLCGNERVEDMKNLIIDQGNSSSKVSLYEDDVLAFTERYEALDVEILRRIKRETGWEQSILSSVVGSEETLLQWLPEHSERFVLLDENTPLPIGNLYKTPRTLGKDRIAVCVGANYMRPNRNLLVIDAGTAITYDIVNAENNYVGGNISLGVDMRFKALNTFTRKLPLVAAEEDVPLTGSDTREAILSGVVNGLSYEIDGFIDSFRSVYPSLLVFLTGGNAKYFEKRIKYCNFVVPNLLSLGLNRILTFR